MNFFILRKLVGLVQTMYDYTNTVTIVRQYFSKRSLSEFKFYAYIVGVKSKITPSKLN